MSKGELLSLFDVTAKKDRFLTYEDFVNITNKIDDTTDIFEKRYVYSKLDPNNEEKVSARDFLVR